MSAIKRNRKAMAGILMVLVPTALIAIQSAAFDNRSYDPSVVRFAMSATVLEADVNPDDALAAAKVWSAKLGTDVGAWTKSEARIFYDLPSLIESVKSDATDVVSLSTQEYLEVESELAAEPALTYVQSGQAEVEYVLIVRKDGDVKTLGDLRGKRIIWSRGGRNCLVPLWLDTILSDNNLPPKEAFFKEIKEGGKASKVVLPVFFGQIDAGIATKTAFETAVTLNPQIGRQIVSIASSPRVVTTVTCMRTDLPVERKNTYINQALRLHESPGTLQTFNIFKLDRLIRWDTKFLDPVRDLYKKQRLSKSPRRGSGRPGFAPKEER
jgi:ABC-type phosphate/phosphonate transport system substrate-binding protein